jgi:hypothetical protein
LIIAVYPKAARDNHLAAFVRFEAGKNEATLLSKGHYLRSYVVNRTAKFLHERWRVGYMQKYKQIFLDVKNNVFSRGIRVPDVVELIDEGDDDSEEEEEIDDANDEDDDNDDDEVAGGEGEHSSSTNGHDDGGGDEEEAEKINPYPVHRGISTISKRADSLWVKDQISKRKLEIPPRWKQENSYQSPPHDSNAPDTRYYHPDRRPRTRWLDKKTHLW